MGRLQAAFVAVILFLPGCDTMLSYPPFANQHTTQTTQPAKAGKIAKVAEAVDMWGPEVLGILGAFGVPGVGAIALLWRKKKQIEKSFIEVVDTIEEGKKKLDTMSLKTRSGRDADPRKVLKAALSTQSPATVARVKKVKARKKN